MEEKQISIIYIVAGISSRFGGKIKQFAKVGPNRETLIEYSVAQAIKAGFNKIIFVVGDKTEKGFKELFGHSFKGVPVFYAFQRFDSEKRARPWGTGAAVCCAREAVDGPFVSCNGDDIYGEETFKILARHLKESDDEATIGYKVIEVLSEKGGVNRGVFKTEGGYVKEIKETFDIEETNLGEKGLNPDDLCSQNIFALHPEVLEMLNSRLENFKKEHAEDRRIEFLLSDELSNLIKEGKIKMKLYETPDKWIGITNPEDEGVVRGVLMGEKL